MGASKEAWLQAEHTEEEIVAAVRDGNCLNLSQGELDRLRDMLVRYDSAWSRALLKQLNDLDNTRPRIVVFPAA